MRWCVLALLGSGCVLKGGLGVERSLTPGRSGTGVTVDGRFALPVTKIMRNTDTAAFAGVATHARFGPQGWRFGVAGDVSGNLILDDGLSTYARAGAAVLHVGGIRDEGFTIGGGSPYVGLGLVVGSGPCVSLELTGSLDVYWNRAPHTEPFVGAVLQFGFL